MKNILYCFLFVITIVPNFAKANCTDLLRLQVLKKLEKKQLYLFGNFAHKYHDAKKKVLHQDLVRFGEYKEVAERRRKLKNVIVLRYALVEGFIPSELRVALHYVNKAIIDPLKVQQWAENLYYDAIVEIYANKSYDSMEYDFFKEIPEKLIIQVMLDRLKEAGFSNNQSDIVHLDRAYEEFEFARLLRNRKLIIDDVSKGVLHGHLIHLFHADFILYILKQNGVDPNIASKLYEWMGSNDLIDLGNYNFDPHIHVWESLFDSGEKDLTSPEEINPALEKFFNIDY